jgi:choline-sulfatase
MKQRPNILFITTDQQRRDTLPCYGADFMKTPALDRLADEGQVYEQAYSVSPVCQPARASFLMGQYPSLTGVGANAKWLRKDSPTIARLFNNAGYHTAAIGKMHFYPWFETEGFTDRVVAEDKRHIYLPDDWTKFLHEHGFQRFHPSQIDEYNQSGCSFTNPLSEDLHVDGFIGNKAVEWIDSVQDEPFFCWVSFNSPHDPYDPPESFADMYADVDIPSPIGGKEDLNDCPDYMIKNLEMWSKNPLFRSNFDDIPKEKAMEWRRKYYACISFIDKQIGKILSSLEAKELLDSTIIIFSSDHGDLLGDHGLPFKSNFYEGSVGVPLIVKGLMVAPGTRVPDRIGWIDLHKTLLSIAGIEVPESSQGIDFSQLWTNPEQTVCDTAYSELDEAVMVQRGRYKLVKSLDGGGILYDTVDDRFERYNLYYDTKYTEIRIQLEEEIHARQLKQITLARYGGGKHPPIPERMELFRKIENGSYKFDGNIKLQ